MRNVTLTSLYTKICFCAQIEDLIRLAQRALHLVGAHSELKCLRLSLLFLLLLRGRLLTGFADFPAGLSHRPAPADLSLLMANTCPIRSLDLARVGFFQITLGKLEHHFALHSGCRIHAIARVTGNHLERYLRLVQVHLGLERIDLVPLFAYTGRPIFIIPAQKPVEGCWCVLKLLAAQCTTAFQGTLMIPPFCTDNNVPGSTTTVPFPAICTGLYSAQSCLLCKVTACAAAKRCQKRNKRTSTTLHRIEFCECELIATILHFYSARQAVQTRFYWMFLLHVGNFSVQKSHLHILVDVDLFRPQIDDLFPGLPSAAWT